MPPKKVFDPSLRYNVVDRQFPHSPVTKVWHTDLSLADALRAKEQIAGSRRSRIVCIEPMDPQPNGQKWGPDMGWIPDSGELGDDAGKWAAAFMMAHGHNLSAIDEGLMIGWFANAIESRPRLASAPAPVPQQQGPVPDQRATATYTLDQMQNAARAAAKGAADEANERHARIVQSTTSSDVVLVAHFCVGPGFLGVPSQWCFWETDYPNDGAYGPYESSAAAVQAAIESAKSAGVLEIVDHVYETVAEVSEQFMMPPPTKAAKGLPALAVTASL